MERKVDFVACDMPSANAFMINVYAAVAQEERRMISDRTKAGLAAAKARGVKLGGPRPRQADASRITVAKPRSKEILQYQDYLNSLVQARPGEATKRARAIIIKYSKLSDDVGREGVQPRVSREPAHKDLRQALRLIDLTLGRAPKNAEYAPLREWLFSRHDLPRMVELARSGTRSRWRRNDGRGH